MLKGKRIIKIVLIIVKYYLKECNSVRIIKKIIKKKFGGLIKFNIYVYCNICNECKLLTKNSINWKK